MMPAAFLIRLILGLTFGVLKTLAGTFASAFLALFFTGVTGHVTALAHDGTQFLVVRDKSAGNAKADGAGLSRDAAAMNADAHAELLEQLRGAQRLFDDHLEVGAFEVLVG